MNYKRIYDSIIKNARSKIYEDYTEKHHILPKCIGGNNNLDNIIVFSAKEHFICHLLLAKIYGGKLIHAAHMMSNMGRYGSKQYTWLKEEHAHLMSLTHRGKIVSKETKQKQSDSWTKERRSNFSRKMKGRKRSKEHTEKIRQKLIGKKHTEEHKRNISIGNKGIKNGMFGKTHTKDARKRMSDANKIKVSCPHCGKEGGVAIMQRWHFNNCKEK